MSESDSVAEETFTNYPGKDKSGEAAAILKIRADTKKSFKDSVVLRDPSVRSTWILL